MSQQPEIESFRAKLVLEREKLKSAASRFSAEQAVLPGADGWSVKDILAHVANAERVNVKFARLMLTQDQPVQLKEVAEEYADFELPFTLDRFNAYVAAKWRAVPLEDVLRHLDATRAETLEWLGTLTPDQLERGGQHAVWGTQTVRGMLKILIIHDKAHTHDLVQRLRE